MDGIIVKLTRGRTAFIDAEDAAKVAICSWSAKHNNYGRWYAYGKINGKQVLMHRYLMGAINRCVQVDHKNGEGLDNRRANLRLCTNAQNQANRAVLSADASSRFRGVCWNKKSKKWQAGIKAAGRLYHLGIWDTEEQAALAYNDAARFYFGEFSRPNEVPA